MFLVRLFDLCKLNLFAGVNTGFDRLTVRPGGFFSTAPATVFVPNDIR